MSSQSLALESRDFARDSRATTRLPLQSVREARA
jgi:hypothetical protein